MLNSILWSLPGRNQILFSSHLSGSSPLEDLAFLGALEDADTVALDFFLADGDGSYDFSHFEECSQWTEEHFSESEIEELCLKMGGEDENVAPSRRRFLTLLSRLLVEQLLPKHRCSKPTESIQIECLERGKGVVSLLTREEMIAPVLKLVELFLKNPLSAWAIRQLILNDGLQTLFSDRYLRMGEAYERGAIDEVANGKPFRSRFRVWDEEAKRQFPLGFNMHVDGLKMGIQAIEMVFAKRLIDCMEGRQGTLFIFDIDHQEALFSELAKREMAVVEVPRGPVKLRGFFWEIYQADRVVGYFLGSVHLVPDWILERMNSRILEAFGASTTLGVEVDITAETWETEVEIPEGKLSAWQSIVAFGLKRYGLDLEGEEGSLLWIQEGINRIWDAFLSEMGTQSGIDLHFIGRAKERGIPVVSLEEEASHRAYLSREKERSLEELTGDPSEIQERFEAFQKAYHAKVCEWFPKVFALGWTRLLDEALQDDSPSEREWMLLRNQQMADRTDALIRSGEIPFSIAGCMHFGGESSLQALMEEKGYSIVQV